MEGYKYLATYILATVIHDLTIIFCTRYIDKKSRTTDQMQQAARSGKQNIAEGYSFQSLESYIKLLGVSVCSIKELTIDYEDYLRQHNLIIWFKNDPRIRIFRDFRAVWRFPNIPNTPNLQTIQNLPLICSSLFVRWKHTCLLIRSTLLKENFH